VMNMARRQAAADPQTRPNDAGCESACMLQESHTHHQHLLLLLSLNGWPNAMCFRITGYNKFEVFLVNTTTSIGRGMYRVLGIIVQRNFAEFHKLRRGIWQNLPQKNGSPAYESTDTEKNGQRYADLDLLTIPKFSACRCSTSGQQSYH